MKETVRNAIQKNVYRAGLAIAALSIASVYAEPRAKEAADKPANVVAHVQLAGGTVTRMLLVKEGGKKYLLLGSDSSAVAIVDVSKPGRAHLVETSAGAMQASAAETKNIAGAVTTFRMLEAEKAIAPSGEEVQGFAGVTASIKDDHGRIYLTNGDGLWIVKTTPAAAADDYTDPNINYYGGGD